MGTGASGRDRRVVRLHAEDAGSWAALGGDAHPDPYALRSSVTAAVARLVGSPPGLELTSSCTHAMEAASVVLGIGPGDEVIVPAFTFPSTANAFLLSGASASIALSDTLTNGPSTGKPSPSPSPGNPVAPGKPTALTVAIPGAAAAMAVVLPLLLALLGGKLGPKAGAQARRALLPLKPVSGAVWTW